MSQPIQNHFLEPQFLQNALPRLRDARPIRNNRYYLNAPQLSQRIGHWTQRENAKYYAFLRKFSLKFSEKQSRRQWKVFKTLARFVKTRNANQCRSHHHKMHKNSSSIEDTLIFLQEKWPNLEQRSQKYALQLNALQSSFFSQEMEKKNQQSPNQGEKNELNLKRIKGESRLEDQEQEIWKKNEIALMKTGVGYEQQLVPVQHNEDQRTCLRSQFNQEVLASYEAPVTSYTNISYQPYQLYNGFNMNDVNSYYHHYHRGHLTMKQIKVLEAHECFIKWITKLSSLVGRQEPEMRMSSNLQAHIFRHYPY